MANCGCLSTFSFNFFVASDCPGVPNTHCTQGAKIFYDETNCHINPGNVAGCTLLSPGCKYRFVLPGGAANGSTVASLVWSPSNATDTISFSDGTILGITNDAPGGQITWNAGTKTISTNSPGQVTFDLLVKGPLFELTNNSAGDLEICQISYQKA